MLLNCTNKSSLRIILLLSLLFAIINLKGQSYTSYFTGNMNDTLTNAKGGICMMGGATENDEAMKWFLQRANGGDVLVLRTSGSDGYNNYMYSSLGIPVHSVETIVFNNASASNDLYIQNKIKQAEAIWFAGGNQWNYISYWRNTPIDSLINVGLKTRNIVVGGTSAGMAILGGIYFSAENGTVTSATALSNPYDTHVQIDTASFLQNDYLQNVITDTHYDNPSRKGRHLVFMARALTDYGMDAKGIACDEYTAVCIDTNGLASVYGGFPTYDDNAYFIQINCEISNNVPENCVANMPLNWNQGGQAIKVCKLKGNANGQNTFNLVDWRTTVGGQWEDYYIDNGVLHTMLGNQINCSTNIENKEVVQTDIQIFPNPAEDFVLIRSTHNIQLVSLLDLNGKLLFSTNPSSLELRIDLQAFDTGIYFLKIQAKNRVSVRKLVVLTN